MAEILKMVGPIQIFRCPTFALIGRAHQGGHGRAGHHASMFIHVKYNALGKNCLAEAHLGPTIINPKRKGPRILFHQHISFNAKNHLNKSLPNKETPVKKTYVDCRP